MTAAAERECTCVYDPETGVAERTREGCPMHDPLDPVICSVCKASDQVGRECAWCGARVVR